VRREIRRSKLNFRHGRFVDDDPDRAAEVKNRSLMRRPCPRSLERLWCRNTAGCLSEQGKAAFLTDDTHALIPCAGGAIYLSLSRGFSAKLDPPHGGDGRSCSLLGLIGTIYGHNAVGHTDEPVHRCRDELAMVRNHHYDFDCAGHNHRTNTPLIRGLVPAIYPTARRTACGLLLLTTLTTVLGPCAACYSKGRRRPEFLKPTVVTAGLWLWALAWVLVCCWSCRR